MLEAIYLLLLSTVLGKIASVVDVISHGDLNSVPSYSLYGAAALSLASSIYIAWPFLFD